MSSPSGPTRRNGGAASPPKLISTSPLPDAPSASTTTETTLSPLLPTPLETLLLAIYPGTLLLGSIFSLLNPPARAAPYSALSQSHPAALAPSYFAHKRNFFNTFFVKIGWFWTTLAFAMFLLLHPSTGPPRTLVLTPRRLQAALRWALVTAWWAVVTQWAFGPGLIDRGFRLTGGVCEAMSSEEGRVGLGMGELGEVVTGAACKLAGGQWRGGHDISGHVFLLTLGSAFLGMEILPVVLKHAGLGEERLVKGREGRIGKAGASVVGIGEPDRQSEVGRGVSGAVVVAGLSWWMLLMTAAYFHTWVEKVRCARCA